jgi:hypothetical protein
MKIHRILVITSLALVTLLITTGVAFTQGSMVDQFTDRIASEPQVQQGELPLDLVVYNNAQANFFLNNPQWVHPGDKFMVVSANAFGGDNEDYNPDFVNNTAQRLLARFPETEVLATTSGRRNTRTAINTVDLSLINIVMTVWEPNNPDFPTEAFNRGDSATVNRVTREFAQEMTNLAHDRGLEYWMKPTGRSTQGRGNVGVLSYRDIISITDGMNVQTQGSCVNNTFARAVDGLINDYEATGSLDKGLFVQISLGGSGPNAVTPAQAFECAQVGWDRVPPVDAVTMWWASSVVADAQDFLRRRENLLPQEPEPTPTPTPEPTPTPTPEATSSANLVARFEHIKPPDLVPPEAALPRKSV